MRIKLIKRKYKKKIIRPKNTKNTRKGYKQFDY